MKNLCVVVMLSFGLFACQVDASGTLLVDAGTDSSTEASAPDAVQDATPDVVADTIADTISEPLDTTQNTAEGYCDWGFRCPPFRSSFQGRYTDVATCVVSISTDLRQGNASCPIGCGDKFKTESCDVLYLQSPTDCYQGCCSAITCR